MCYGVVNVNTVDKLLGYGPVAYTRQKYVVCAARLVVGVYVGEETVALIVPRPKVFVFEIWIVKVAVPGGALQVKVGRRLATTEPSVGPSRVGAKDLVLNMITLDQKLAEPLADTERTRQK